MADGRASSSVAAPATAETFRVAARYHPIAHTPDLTATEAFYGRVFGRPSTNLSEIMPIAPAPGHSNDHAVFTTIGDVLIESLQPSKYFTRGVQRYPDAAEPHLETTGWSIVGAKHLYRALRTAGYHLVDARDEQLEAEEWTGGPSPFYGREDEMGLRYQFFEAFRFPLDPRDRPGWTGPSVTDDDPLQIIGSSHHTVVTSRPDRALRLLVDVLGGERLADAVDQLRAAAGPVVRLADTVVHLAVPTADGLAECDLARREPLDSFHAITWRVRDLDRVVAHLDAEGVGIERRSETALVTDPSSSLGVAWGFTTKPTIGAAA